MVIIVANILSTIFIGLLCIIGWFVKKDLTDFKQKLDKHDDILMKVVSDVSKLIGYQEGSRQ